MNSPKTRVQTSKRRVEDSKLDKKILRKSDIWERGRTGEVLGTVFEQQGIKKVDPMRSSGITNGEKVFGSGQLVDYCIISKYLSILDAKKMLCSMQKKRKKKKEKEKKNSTL